MKIAFHPDAMRAMDAFKRGDGEAGHALQDGFPADFRAHFGPGREDHCSCTVNCKHHGNCVECAALHPGHGGHLPNCFRPMVNRQLRKISALTEDSLPEE